MPTDVLKRRIGVYPKSWEQRKRWQEEADRKGIPLSKFLIMLIEEGLDKDRLDDKNLLYELKKENRNQKEENKNLKREIARLTKLISIQEDELEIYRNKAFLDKSFTGIRTFNKDLISTLKEANRPLTDEELLQRCGVALTDMEAIKGISTQLEALQDYGLAKLSKNGWRWSV